MALNVDAMQPGINPNQAAAEGSVAPESSHKEEGTAKRWLSRFMNSRLGKLAAALFFAVATTGISVTPSGGIEKPVNPDSADASKIPPVPTMMAGSSLPESTPPELKSSAEKQEFTKDQQDFIEIMSGFLAPDVIGEIKDAFGGRRGLPKQFTVSDSDMGRSYIFQFPKPPDGKTELGLTMIDLFLQNQGNVVWHAQTGDENIPSDFPNQKPIAAAHSEQELARKALRFLAPRYQTQKPTFYSDKYNFRLGVRLPTPDGGEEWWTISANRGASDIVPACIYLTGQVTPSHSSEVIVQSF